MKKTVVLVLTALLLLAGCSTPALAPISTTAPQATSAPTIAPTPVPTIAPTEAPTATPEPTVAPTPTPASGTLKGSGTIGDYDVTIEKITTGKTYDGKPGVYVYYKWKNNSDKADMFMVAVSAKVFQGGIECEIGISDMKSKIDTNASLKEIKPGTEQEVVEFYALNDASTPISVEVTDLLGLGDVTVQSDFNLK